MRYSVRVTDEAEKDLLDIYNYVAQNDDPLKDDRLLDKLEETCLALEAYPNRGHVPPELERLGIHDFRETHFKPYRIVYEVTGEKINILAVLDGRRDLKSLLERRLLR